MKIVLQRVSQAAVVIDGKTVGQIGRGILIYLGIFKEDTETQALSLAKKAAEFRIFPDQARKMNLSLLDIQGQALVVSQFTLATAEKSGRRPGFDAAALPEQATPLYEAFIRQLRSLGVNTHTGVFGAYMQVNSINDGPVTFILEK